MTPERIEELRRTFGTDRPGLHASLYAALHEALDEVERLQKQLAEYECEPEMDLSMWPEDLQRQIRKLLASGRKMRKLCGGQNDS
jgi:hypothetical protein